MRADPTLTFWAAIMGPQLLQLRFRDGPRVEDVWCDFDQPQRFARLLAALDGPMVGLAPRKDRHPEAATQTNALWVRVETGESCERLHRFRPTPTVILSETNMRRTAVWALAKPLGYGWAVQANKRLAHALKAPKKWAGLESLVPVRSVGYADPQALFSAREVVGRLRDAPDPRAWRRAA